MFNPSELKLIHDNIVYRIQHDNEMLSYETERNKQLFDKITLIVTNDVPTPTETPIEQLKSGDSVWAKVSNEFIKNGEKLIYDGIDEDFYVSLLHNPFRVARQYFYDYFTTIPPVTTTKINRAELLDVVKAMLPNNEVTEQLTSQGIVKYAIELINEVNKVSYGE